MDNLEKENDAWKALEEKNGAPVTLKKKLRGEPELESSPTGEVHDTCKKCHKPIPEDQKKWGTGLCNACYDAGRSSHPEVHKIFERKFLRFKPKPENIGIEYTDNGLVIDVVA